MNPTAVKITALAKMVLAQAAAARKNADTFKARELAAYSAGTPDWNALRSFAIWDLEAKTLANAAAQVMTAKETNDLPRAKWAAENALKAIRYAEKEAPVN